MIVEVLLSLFGNKFVGLPVFKMAPSVVTLGKYLAGGYAFWSCMQAPQLVSRNSHMRVLMMKAFRAAKIYNVHKRRDLGDGQIKDFLEYPRIERISRNNGSISVSFQLPPGFNPKVLEERAFVFQQLFGQHAKLIVGSSIHQLVVSSPLPASVPYSFSLVQKSFNLQGGLPVFAGINQGGEPVCYDMRQKPHLGVVGVTGYGKSSFLRVLLCSWLQFFGPEQLQLYLGDLKRTEFQQYRGVQHVKKVAVSRSEVTSMLGQVVILLDQRSALLGKVRASNIDQYRKKTGISLPYVVVCIDEVALLASEKKAHEYLEEIGAIGRALGVFLVLSQQRVDSEVMDGKLKNNLTVRVAYRMSDALNSRMFLDNDSAAHLTVPGRAIVKEPNRITEVQTPWLSEEEAEQIIERYRLEEPEEDLDALESAGSPFEDIVFGEVAVTCDQETKRF